LTDSAKLPAFMPPDLERVSQAVELDSDQISLPEPELETFNILSDGLVPFCAPLKLKLSGFRLITVGSGGAPATVSTLGMTWRIFIAPAAMAMFDEIPKEDSQAGTIQAASIVVKANAAHLIFMDIVTSLQ
jgi:hypothetical protein